MTEKVRKLTEKQVLKCWADTQECYCKALVETYPEELSGAKPESFRVRGVDRELRSHLLDLGLEANSPDIHRRYMTHVKQLSTKQLETIIAASNQGQIRRAPHTIDEIASELLDRTLKETQ